MQEEKNSYDLEIKGQSYTVCFYQIEGAEFIDDSHGQTSLSTSYKDERFISDTDNERRKLVAE